MSPILWFFCNDFATHTSVDKNKCYTHLLLASNVEIQLLNLINFPLTCLINGVCWEKKHR